MIIGSHDCIEIVSYFILSLISCLKAGIGKQLIHYVRFDKHGQRPK